MKRNRRQSQASNTVNYYKLYVDTHATPFVLTLCVTHRNSKKEVRFHILGLCVLRRTQLFLGFTNNPNHFGCATIVVRQQATQKKSKYQFVNQNNCQPKRSSPYIHSCSSVSCVDNNNNNQTLKIYNWKRSSNKGVVRVRKGKKMSGIQSARLKHKQ